MQRPKRRDVTRYVRLNSQGSRRTRTAHLTYVMAPFDPLTKPSSTVETGSLTWYLILLALGLATGFLIAWLRKIFGDK